MLSTGMRTLHTCNLHRIGNTNKVTMRQRVRARHMTAAPAISACDKTGR